jgi:hypothetical protein
MLQLQSSIHFPILRLIHHHYRYHHYQSILHYRYVLKYNPQRPDLTYLELDGVAHIPSLLTILPNFTNLTHLVLNPSRRAASLHHHFLTDDLVCNVITHCHALKHLVVPIIGDGPLIRLAELDRRIETLDLVSGREVNDSGFVLFAKRCGGWLRSLDMAGASGVGEVGYIVLARSCDRLRRLVMPRGVGVRRVVEGFLEGRGRESIEVLGGVCGVGVEELGNMLARFERLVWVGVSGGNGRVWIGRGDGERIKGQCRRLKHIVVS